MTFTPTCEQEHAMALSSENQVVKIEAGAGCGKSSTLALVAGQQRVNSLYLAFNKALADEAKSKFPDWVKCRTTHSLAYASFGGAIQSKLKRPIGPYVNVCGTGAEIARYYRIGAGKFCEDQEKVITAAGMGIAVKETVNRFEYSADKEIALHHVSFSPAKQFHSDQSFDKRAYSNIILSYAQLLWKERIDPNSKVLANHDTYLKLFQLSEPDLSEYEIIYLDESQDSNDCVIDIVQRQENSKIILVGDDAQTLYAWRGSVSAMGKFDGVTAALTTSFRFGPRIAEVAKAILSLREAGGLDLKGYEKIDSKVVDWLPDELRNESRCHLYRMNSTLVFDAVKFIMQGKKVALEIDVRDFVNMLNSMIALSRGDTKNVKHEEVVPYRSWQALKEEIDYVGGDIQRVYRIVNDGEASKVLAALDNYKKPDNPELILTTGHKSKGREFDIVVLADDFPPVYNNEGEWIGLEDGEACLLYVASTRAIKYLVTNQTLRDILTKKRIATVAVTGITQYDHIADFDMRQNLALVRELGQLEELDDDGDEDAPDKKELAGILHLPLLDCTSARFFGINPLDNHCF